MVRDDHGHLIPPLEQDVAFGSTPFERSLHTSFADLYDVEKIRYCIMVDLLESLAKRDGPNTANYTLLEELNGLHVITDSARVHRIFHNGLLELDREWGAADSSYFLDVELRRRAEQIRQCGCFLPESERYFDELGRLIARLGVYEMLSFSESSMIVRFPNGIHASVGFDQNYEHRINSASSSLDRILTKRDLENLRDQAGESDAGERPEGFAAAFLRDSSDLKIDEMDAYGRVAIDADYEELPVDRISLHIIPTSYGDGRWNGKGSGENEGPWTWSRAFLDFYLNLREVAQRSADGEYGVNLDIEYEIFRLTDTGVTKVAGELIPAQFSSDDAGDNDGISFRLFTLPFVTDGTSAEGDYQLNVCVSTGEKKMIRKYPFAITDRTYDLMLVDEGGPQHSGLPMFPRIPEARAGKRITVMIPVRKLPFCVSDSTYCAEVRLYLFRNDEVREGSVRIGDLFAFTFEDSTGAGMPEGLPDSSAFSAGPRPVELISVREEFSDAYLRCSFTVPRQLPDGTPVRAGRYSLAAMVSGKNGRIADAVMTDLYIR